MPLALTDHQLDTLARAANYLPQAQHDNFMRSVAGALGDKLRPSDRELIDVLTLVLSQRGVAVGRSALAVGRPDAGHQWRPVKIGPR
jgi:hypothetical protein